MANRKARNLTRPDLNPIGSGRIGMKAWSGRVTKFVTRKNRARWGNWRNQTQPDPCSPWTFLFKHGILRLQKLLEHSKKGNWHFLVEGLQKLKEELMLSGCISLMLSVLQGATQEICIPKTWMRHMNPCKFRDRPPLSGVVVASSIYCQKKGKVPLLSVEAVHQLHIFIFVLAVAHVVLSVITMIFGHAQIRKWERWEDSIPKENKNASAKVNSVRQNEYLKGCLKGHGKFSSIRIWLSAIVKQFYGSITESDYTMIRQGFIEVYIKSNQEIDREFDFQKNVIQALKSDLKKVAEIRWYLWAFVISFLLLNVNGWHVYFWVAIIPLVLLLAVGVILVHINREVLHLLALKHSADDLEVIISDGFFWLKWPEIVLFFIHLILFQNAFELAFFFRLLTTYGFNSCSIGAVGFTITRLVISVIIQLLWSYSTLPWYCILKQMVEGICAEGESECKGREVTSMDDRSNMEELGWDPAPESVCP